MRMITCPLKNIAAMKKGEQNMTQKVEHQSKRDILMIIIHLSEN